MVRLNKFVIFGIIVIVFMFYILFNARNDSKYLLAIDKNINIASKSISDIAKRDKGNSKGYIIRLEQGKVWVAGNIKEYYFEPKTRQVLAFVQGQRCLVRLKTINGRIIFASPEVAGRIYQ